MKEDKNTIVIDNTVLKPLYHRMRNRIQVRKEKHGKHHYLIETISGEFYVVEFNPKYAKAPEEHTAVIKLANDQEFKMIHIVFSDLDKMQDYIGDICLKFYVPMVEKTNENYLFLERRPKKSSDAEVDVSCNVEADDEDIISTVNMISLLGGRVSTFYNWYMSDGYYSHINSKIILSNTKMISFFDSVGMEESMIIFFMNIVANFTKKAGDKDPKMKISKKKKDRKFHRYGPANRYSNAEDSLDRNLECIDYGEF